ncbi:MAG TPA: DoxX family protein [Steroidobacteraceae bacterium]
MTIQHVLGASWFGYSARVLLTFVFWSSGVMKLVRFRAGVAEMQMFGLRPAWAFNVATICVQLIGSALVVFSIWTWLGAGLLALFTALTIPIAHRFWTMPEPMRTLDFCIVLEHVTVIGALMVVAIASPA